MIGHTVRKSAPGADLEVTSKILCCLEAFVFAAARAGCLREAPTTSRRENAVQDAGGLVPPLAVRSSAAC
jgi:hypothetical protein